MDGIAARFSIYAQVVTLLEGFDSFFGIRAIIAGGLGPQIPQLPELGLDLLHRIAAHAQGQGIGLGIGTHKQLAGGGTDVSVHDQAVDLLE